MTIEQCQLQGFIKRAQEYGISKQQAIKLAFDWTSLKNNLFNPGQPVNEQAAAKFYPQVDRAKNNISPENPNGIFSSLFKGQGGILEPQLYNQIRNQPMVPTTKTPETLMSEGNFRGAFNHAYSPGKFYEPNKAPSLLR